jgi:cell division protein FtsI (penicillin-binding protein 3)
VARDEKVIARLRNLALIGLVLFALLIGRLFEIQIVRHDYYSRKAKNQQIEKVDLQPDRGTIFDRNGKSLAISRDIFSLYTDPTFVKDPAGTARSLSKALGYPVQQIEKKLRSRTKFEWIERRIPLEKKRLIASLHLEGLYFMLEKGRFYPGGSLLAQVLGFCGLDNIGRWGLEESLQERLQGKKGYVYMVRDAEGRKYMDLSLPRVSPVKGEDVVLTIDARLQEIVELALARAVLEVEAKGGAIVAVDPATGEILAMASYPTVDLYELWPPLDEDVYDLLRNRATMDLFEPGSTFKLITMAALLENKMARPGELIFCEHGVYRVGGRTIVDVHPEGWLTVKEVFAKSSNIGMSKLVDRLSRDSFLKTVKDFGIGTTTGIEFMSEQKGLLNKPGGRGWSGYTMRSMAYGQEVSVTALQMALAFAAVANGGELLVPHMVKEIRGPGGSVVWSSQRKALWRCIATETSRMLKGFMREVVENGTGTRAKVGTLALAGKTGTAQKAIAGKGYVDGKYVATFGGFLPADTPGIVLFVMIDEPQGRYYGGDVAAPAFREIVESVLLSCPELVGLRTLVQMDGLNRVTFPSGLLNLKEFPLQNLEYGERRYVLPTSKGYGQVPRHGEGVAVVPDFLGLSVRDALELAEESGLLAAVSGSGFVVEQEPLPGALIPRGGECSLQSAFVWEKECEGERDTQ